MRTESWKSCLRRSGTVFGLTVLSGVCGCRSAPANNIPAPIIDAASAPDPAAMHSAPVSGPAPATYRGLVSERQPARVLGQQAYAPPPSSKGEQYPEGANASYPAQNYPAQNYPAQGYPAQGYPAQGYPAQGQGTPYPAGGDGTDAAYDAGYEQLVDSGGDALYADQPPPPLPVYQQPELTDPGYQWTPGYWSYAPQGYYWVPGAWVAPPFVGALWTPGYWGAYGGRYRFHHGFWGRQVGFYGGVPYGFGYTGRGYEGGYWNGDRFFYNNAVNRVDRNTVRNVYARDVTQVNTRRASYNGPGGWNARPTAADAAALREQRSPAMPVQRQRVQEAASNRQQFATENRGRPPITVLTEHQSSDRTPPAAVQPGPRPQQNPVQGQGGFGVPGGGRQAGSGAQVTQPPTGQPPNARQQDGYRQQQNQYRQPQNQNQQPPQNQNRQPQQNLQQGGPEQGNRQGPRPLPPQSAPQLGVGQTQDQQRPNQDGQRQNGQRQWDGQRQMQDRQGPAQTPSRIQPAQVPRPQQAPSRPQPVPQAAAPRPQPAPASRPQEVRPAETSHPAEGHPHR